MSRDNDLFPNSSRLMNHLVELEERESLSLVERLLAEGEAPLQIVECCQSAMKDVGQYYEKGHYFLSGLMMAGEILRQVMEMVLPILTREIQGIASGRVMIGTVQGDIHDIGKNLVAMLFRCHGFDVLDLGVDVPPMEFVDRAREFQPDVVAMSALLITAHDAIKETIELFTTGRLEGLKTVRTIVGGGFMNEHVCRYVGADYWARDAITGVRYCQKMLTDK